MKQSYLAWLLMVVLVTGGCGVAPSTLPVGTKLPEPTPVMLDEAAPQKPPEAAPTANTQCSETTPHPIAQSIAETYDAPYEEVMSFFCTGVAFEDIVLAYQTADLAEIEVKEALTLWYDFGSWEEVWDELGID